MTLHDVVAIASVACGFIAAACFAVGTLALRAANIADLARTRWAANPPLARVLATQRIQFAIGAALLVASFALDVAAMSIADGPMLPFPKWLAAPSVFAIIVASIVGVMAWAAHRFIAPIAVMKVLDYLDQKDSCVESNGATRVREHASHTARWGLLLSLVSTTGLIVNIWFTHIYHPERLEVGVVEYRLADGRDGGSPFEPYIDVAIINRGKTAARYIGSQLYATFAVGEPRSVPLAPFKDFKTLVEPGTIVGVELRFPAFDADQVRRVFADAGADTAEVSVALALEVQVMDSHGRLIAGVFDLDQIRFWQRGGIDWGNADEAQLLQVVLPDGAPARRIRGSSAFWPGFPFGLSFDADGSIKNVGFYPDSTEVGAERRQ